MTALLSTLRENSVAMVAASALLVAALSLCIVIMLPIGDAKKDNRLVLAICVMVIAWGLALCFGAVAVANVIVRAATC